MSPKDRCLVLLEVKRLLSEVWSHAPSESDKARIEEALMVIRPLLADWCRDLKLPFT